MFLLLIEQPDAAFIGLDSLEGFLEQLEQHFVADAEEILRRHSRAELGKVFLRGRSQRNKTLFRKKIRASRSHSGGWRRALVSLTSAGISCGCSCNSFFNSTRSSSVLFPLANLTSRSRKSAGIVSAAPPATSPASPSQAST